VRFFIPTLRFSHAGRHAVPALEHQDDPDLFAPLPHLADGRHQDVAVVGGLDLAGRLEPEDAIRQVRDRLEHGRSVASGGPATGPTPRSVPSSSQSISSSAKVRVAGTFYGCTRSHRGVEAPVDTEQREPRPPRE
jgi:hypothetical protein